MRNYLQHAGRHVPTGSDPTPFSSVPWAYINSDGTPVSCPPSTTRIAADSSTFYTNAPGYFSAANSGGGVMGIKLLSDGHYLFWMTATATGALTAGDAFELIPEGGGEVPDFQFSPPKVIVPSGGSSDTLETGGLMAVGDFITAPTDSIVCRIDNTAGGHTVNWQYTGLVVIQLDHIVTDLS